MPFWQGLLYLLAVAALAVAWLLAVAGAPNRYALAVLAAALALLAYSLPVINAGLR